MTADTVMAPVASIQIDRSSLRVFSQDDIDGNRVIEEKEMADGKEEKNTLG